MDHIDLVIGIKNELLSNYLVKQYIKKESDFIKTKLYKNSKLNKNIINIITEYSLSIIFIEKIDNWSHNKYMNFNKTCESKDIIIICANEFVGINLYSLHSSLIKNIYTSEKYSIDLFFKHSQLKFMGFEPDIFYHFLKN